MCQQDAFGAIHTVAGVDVGVWQRQTLRAAVVVLAWPELTVLTMATAQLPARFPYVPGLLAFREMPVLLAAFSQLKQRPDLIFCDGGGRLHPQRCGLACHLGLWLDLPTIGVAKSHFIGEYDSPGDEAGQWAFVLDKHEVIGAVLRNKKRTNPLFISVGHRISLASAIRWVTNCTTHYRLPEPTRLAHQFASLSPKG